MKKIFFLLTVCRLQPAYCQFIYTNQNLVENSFTSIREEIASENLLITNSNYTYNPSSSYIKYDTHVFKISSSGQYLDSIALDSNLIVYGPILSYNNNYFLYGIQTKGHNPATMINFPIIIQYDMAFNVVKRVILDSVSGPVTAVQNMIVKNNAFYLGYNYGAINKISLYKLTTNLIKSDSLIFNGQSLASICNYGNHILISGLGFPNGGPLGNIQVAELDTNFNTISRFNLDSVTSVNPGCFQKVGMTFYNCNLFEVSSNKYIASGYSPVTYTYTNSSCLKDFQHITSIIKNNSTIIKTDILGQQNGINELYYNPVSCASKKYNFIYSVSMSNYDPLNPDPPQSNPTKIMANKIDTSGNVIWNKFYDSPGYYYCPISVAGTSDSGVVISGMRYSLSSPAVLNVCEGFVMKLDKNGNQVSTGINDEKIKGFVELELFPNPATDNVYLSVSTNKNEYGVVRILDIAGQTVYQDSVILDLGENNLTFNVRNLSAGIYTFVFSSKTSITTKKLSVIK